jgi:hypothetical protein
MALFGKKEKEEKMPGAQPPSVKKDGPKAPKKAAPDGPAGVGGVRDTTKETTYLGKNLKITGNLSGEGNR